MELKYFSQSNQTLLQNICVHIPQTIDLSMTREIYTDHMNMIVHNRTFCQILTPHKAGEWMTS